MEDFLLAVGLRFCTCGINSASAGLNLQEQRRKLEGGFIPFNLRGAQLAWPIG